MKCPSCGVQNKESAKFCFKCGFKLLHLAAPPVIPMEYSTPQVSQKTVNVSLPTSNAVEDVSTKPLISAALIFKDNDLEVNIPFKPVVYIGRADKKSGLNPDIDMSELDTGKVVSRRHSYISCSNGKYKIADQGSLNGTFLNGVKLEKDIEYELKNGDEIIFGKVFCIFNCIG